MSTDFPSWVTDAARLPIAFAQVREDPELDRKVVESLGWDVRVIMIASGGCGAALLASCTRVARLHLVDANPAQIALTRLKLHLRQHATSAERLGLLGHTPIPAAERRRALAGWLDGLGPADVVCELGPDQAGRYERVFARLREELASQADAVRHLLSLSDPAEQARRLAADPDLDRALDAAFGDAMALPNLVALFGEGATNNPVEPFARHFARRTRLALETFPASRNPYLWQVLVGTYYPFVPARWLSLGPPVWFPNITFETAFMADALRRASAEYDFVHLSNILDWLTPDEARATLDAARGALRPGGLVFVRQLNSTLPIRDLDAGFDWLPDGDALHARDRSYFYRALHLGRRR